MRIAALVLHIMLALAWPVIGWFIWVFWGWGSNPDPRGLNLYVVLTAGTVYVVVSIIAFAKPQKRRNLALYFVIATICTIPFWYAGIVTLIESPPNSSTISFTLALSLLALTWLAIIATSFRSKNPTPAN